MLQAHSINPGIDHPKELKQQLDQWLEVSFSHIKAGAICTQLAREAQASLDQLYKTSPGGKPAVGALFGLGNNDLNFNLLKATLVTTCD